MSEITKSQVDLYQGEDTNDRVFGYVAGDDGGFFFTWMDTLDATLDSIEVDEVDGDGGLEESDVREFLASYLPTTAGGRKRQWQLETEGEPVEDIANGYFEAADGTVIYSPEST